MAYCEKIFHANILYDKIFKLNCKLYSLTNTINQHKYREASTNLQKAKERFHINNSTVCIKHITHTNIIEVIQIDI